MLIYFPLFIYIFSLVISFYILYNLNKVNIMLGKDILCFLETEMVRPKPYGWFHLLWVGLAIVAIIFLFVRRRKNTEKQLKLVLGIYGVIAFILETLKQIIWSVDYDAVTNVFTWDYQWYAAPFQLCTMPIYVCLICLFLSKGRVRDSLLSFMAYVTILGSIATAIIPNDVFVEDILINIHTMWLHLGSLVVSVYLLMSREVLVSRKDFIRSIITFVIFILIANTLNIIVYNSGVLNGETFNMFYISPYFESTLPVFDKIYTMVPYPVFLLIYFVALTLGAYIIYIIARMFISMKRKLFIRKNKVA